MCSPLKELCLHLFVCGYGEEGGVLTLTIILGLRLSVILSNLLSGTDLSLPLSAQTPLTVSRPSPADTGPCCDVSLST